MMARIPLPSHEVPDLKASFLPITANSSQRIYLWLRWRIYTTDLYLAVLVDLPGGSTQRIYLWRWWRVRLLLEPERAELEAGVLEGVARLEVWRERCDGREQPLMGREWKWHAAKMPHPASLTAKAICLTL